MLGLAIGIPVAVLLILLIVILLICCLCPAACAACWCCGNRRDKEDARASYYLQIYNNQKLAYSYRLMIQ